MFLMGFLKRVSRQVFNAKFLKTCLRKKTEGYFLPFWLGSHNHISISANSVKVWTFFTSIFKVSKSSLHMSA